MFLGEGIEDGLHLLVAGFAGHRGLLGQGCEIVDGERVAGREPGARLPHDLERAVHADALTRQNPFLQVQHAIQTARKSFEQLADTRQGQAKALERHDLVQPRDLVRTVGPPAGLRAQWLHEPALLVEPERLDRHAEALRGFGGVEVSVVGSHGGGSLH